MSYLKIMLRNYLLLSLIFGILLSYTTLGSIPNAYAADFKTSTDCTDDFFILDITRNGTEDKVQNVTVYTLDGKRNILEKFVSNDEGIVKIPKTNMTNMLKLTKGGFNDITIASDCFIKSKPLENRDQNASYGKDYTEKSQENLIVFCDSNYQTYKLIGPQEFLKMNSDSISGVYARKCIILYQSEVWSYAEEDRVQVLNKWLEEYSIKQTAETQQERNQNTINAKINADTSVKTSLSVEQLQERINFLEKQLEEKDRQIANKDSILMEQLKVIRQLASSFKKTFFDPVSTILGFT